MRTALQGDCRVLLQGGQERLLYGQVQGVEKEIQKNDGFSEGDYNRIIRT